MTTKDIRDIAAYTGCAYSVEVFDQNPEKGGWPVEWYTKQGAGKGLLFRLGEITADSYESEQSIRNLKLHLRPMASLTDEEWNTGLSLLDAGEGVTLTLRERNPHGMIHAGPLAIRFDGAVSASYYISVTPLWAYLQSIGIYIPGTIDEQYVQLI